MPKKATDSAVSDEPELETDGLPMVPTGDDQKDLEI